MKTLNLTRLGREEISEITRLHADSRAELDKFLVDLYLRTPKTIDWKCNSLFSKNNMMTDFYFDLFCVIYSKIQIDKGLVSRVVVKNTAQYEALSSVVGKQKLAIVGCNGSKKPYVSVVYLKVFGDIWRNIRRTAHEVVLKSSERKSRARTQKSIVLIDTFWIESSFKDNTFVDRYYPNLRENLPEDWSEKVFFLPNLISKKQFKKKVQVQEALGIKNLFRHDFLIPLDYVVALYSCFRIIRAKIDCPEFFGIDITPLIYHEIRLNCAQPSSFDAILNYRFWRRLRSSGIKVSLLIDWYENHAVDKGMQAGRRTFCPSTPSVGYQGVIYDYEYHNCARPCDLEKEMEVLPDRIALVGEWIIKDVFKKQAPVELSLAPGFRFWVEREKIVNPETTREKFSIVLVVLPIDDIVSREILNQICTLLLNIDHDMFKWKILPHPLTGKELLSKLKHLGFGVVVEGVHNHLKDASLVIGGGSSSAYIECLIAGIPVVTVVHTVDDFLQQPIPEKFPLRNWISCSHLMELNLSEIIQKAKLESTFTQADTQVKARLIEPVTGAGVRAMFSIGDAAQV